VASYLESRLLDGLMNSLFLHRKAVFDLAARLETKK